MSTRIDTLFGYDAVVMLEVEGRRCDVNALRITEYEDGCPVHVEVDMEAVAEAVDRMKQLPPLSAPRDPGKSEWGGTSFRWPWSKR